jgi:hypothetical protein
LEKSDMNYPSITPTPAFIEAHGCYRVPYDTPHSTPEPYRRWLEQRTPVIVRTLYGGWRCTADCWRHCSGNDLSTETGIRHGLFELAPEQLVLDFEGVST